MKPSGKLVVVGFFVLALGAWVFTLEYQVRATRRAMRFWGTEVALMIARGSHVEAIRLAAGEAATEGKEMLTIRGKPHVIVERRDMSNAKGLTHLRWALREDASFRWDEPSPSEAPSWGYAVRFSGDSKTTKNWGQSLDNGHTTVTVVISEDGRFVARVQSEAWACSAPIAKGLLTILNEQF